MIQGTIHDVIQIHLNQSSKTFFTSNDFNFARVLSLSEWITHNRFDLFFYHFYFPKKSPRQDLQDFNHSSMNKLQLIFCCYTI